MKRKVSVGKDAAGVSAGEVFRVLLCPGCVRAARMAAAGEGSPAGGGAVRGGVPESAAAWLRQEEESLSLRVFGEKRPVPDRGKRMSFRMGGRVLLEGRADAVFLDEVSSSALVVVYDFGLGEDVSCSACGWHLAAVSVLLAHELGYMPHVHAAVLRPFAGDPQVFALRFAPPDLLAARESLLKALVRAEEEGAECVPGESACCGCRGRSVCEAGSRGLESLAVLAEGEAWKSLPPDRKLAVFRLAKLAEQAAARVYGLCEEDFAEGRPIPGLAMMPGRQLFAVKDASAALSLLADRFPERVTAVSFARCCKVNVSELDRLVYAARRDAGEQVSARESREFLRQLLSPCSESRLSKGSLKLCGDGGPSVPGMPW